MASVDDTRMRRRPSQERSKERVDRILLAAEHLFSTKGYAAATTNEIARRAETSIGSLYRFFPDKEAIMNALIERYLDEFFGYMGDLVTKGIMSLPLDAMVDRIMDGVVSFYDQYATQIAVIEQTQLTPDQWKLYEQLTDTMIAVITENLKEGLPNLPKRKRHAIAYACWYCTEGVDKAVKFKSKRFAKDVDREVRTMMVRYLEPYFDN